MAHRVPQIEARSGRNVSIETPSSLTPPPIATQARDRTSAIAVMGVVLLLLGVLCFLFLGFMLLGSQMPRPAVAGAPPPLRSLLPALAVYLGAGVFFAVTGVGSLMFRRWARALVSAVSRLWLAGGLLATGMSVWLLPKVVGGLPAATPGAAPVPAILLGCMFGCISVGYVAVPLLLVWFYGSANVRATFDRRDPTARWTDRCPDRVLVLVLSLGYIALGSLCMPLLGMAFAFGQVLTGALAGLWTAAIVAVAGTLTVGVYRLRPAAWWGTLAFLLVGAVAWSGFFFDAARMERMYREMGVDVSPPPMQELLKIFDSPALGIVSAACAALAVVYLLWLRRDFSPPPPAT
jgi:hypothetical protein